MADTTSNSAAPAANVPTSPELENQTIEETPLEGELSASEAVAEAEEIVADPNASKAQKVEAKKRLKSIKLKVDGQEFEEKLPFEIDEDQADYWRKHLQMSKVANKRMQEKAQLQTDVEQFIQMLRENPDEVFDNPHIALDKKKWATKFIEEEIENQKKSPEQLELEKTKKELKKLKEDQERKDAEVKQRDQQRLRDEQVERFDIMMEQAFSKFPDVPQTPQSVSRISDYMVLAFKNGMDVTPEDVIPLVRDEIEAELQHKLKNSSDDAIEKMLGKDRLTSIRKKRVAEAKKAALPSKINDTGASSEKKDATPQVKKTIRGMFGV